MNHPKEVSILACLLLKERGQLVAVPGLTDQKAFSVSLGRFLWTQFLGAGLGFEYSIFVGVSCCV